MRQVRTGFGQMTFDPGHNSTENPPTPNSHFTVCWITQRCSLQARSSVVYIFTVFFLCILNSQKARFSAWPSLFKSVHTTRQVDIFGYSDATTTLTRWTRMSHAPEWLTTSQRISFIKALVDGSSMMDYLRTVNYACLFRLINQSAYIWRG